MLLFHQMDVWILLKRWILVDRKRRLPHYRQLLQSIRYNLLNNQQVNKLFMLFKF